MTWAVLLLAIALVLALTFAVAHEFRSHQRTKTLQRHVDLLQHQVEELRAEQAAARRAADPEREGMPTIDGSVVDAESGLHNAEFFRATLDTRVSAARRQLRPLAVVLLTVANGVRDGDAPSAPPALVGQCVTSTLRDADTACRLDDRRYALILDDTPENGAVWTVERVRRAIAEQEPGKTVWAGVSCYPATAFSAADLLTRADDALAAAREWPQDRIEVAAASEP